MGGGGEKLAVLWIAIPPCHCFKGSQIKGRVNLTGHSLTRAIDQYNRTGSCSVSSEATPF